MQTQHAIALMFAIFADCLNGVTARKLENGVKIAIVFTPLIFDATVRGPGQNIALTFGMLKSE